MDSVVFLAGLYNQLYQMPFLDLKRGHMLFHSFPDYQHFHHTVVILHVRLNNFVYIQIG